VSVKVSTWVWEHSPVGGNKRLVLLAIADNASDDGTNAWPSLATLARKTLLDERTVRRILRSLENDGHLKIDVSAGPSGTNRYAVIMHPPEQTPGQNAPRANCPPGKQTPPPDTATPPSPGHSYAPRTSLNVQRTSKRDAALRREGDGKPSAALPRPRCPRHPALVARYCCGEDLAGDIP
jgi:hypothetical protein